MERNPRGGTVPTTAMDYTLAALKLFGSQLAGSTTAPSSEGSSAAQMLFGTRFQRAWLQVPTTTPSLSPPRSTLPPFVARSTDDLQWQAGRDRAGGLQRRQ